MKALIPAVIILTKIISDNNIASFPPLPLHLVILPYHKLSFIYITVKGHGSYFLYTQYYPSLPFFPRLKFPELTVLTPTQKTQGPKSAAACSL